MSDFGIPGVIHASEASMPPPRILCIAPEKVGKSTTVTLTLNNWPCPGKQALVIAIDKTGVQSCRELGFDPAHIPVEDQPGSGLYDKLMFVLKNVETAMRKQGDKFPFSAIILDCATKLSNALFDESREDKKEKDPRKNYGEALEQGTSVMRGFERLGLPLIWLGIQKDGVEQTSGSGPNKRVKLIMGGIATTGSFGKQLAGIGADQIVILTKRKVGKADGADKHGFIREFRTQQYELVEAGGRFSLPNPMEANMGTMLNLMYFQRGFMPPGVDEKWWVNEFTPWAEQQLGKPGADE